MHIHCCITCCILKAHFAYSMVNHKHLGIFCRSESCWTIGVIVCCHSLSEDLVKLGDGTDQTRSLANTRNIASTPEQLSHLKRFIPLMLLFSIFKSWVFAFWKQTTTTFSRSYTNSKATANTVQYLQKQFKDSGKQFSLENLSWQWALFIFQNWSLSWEDLGFQTCNEKFSDQTDVVAFLPVAWP